MDRQVSSDANASSRASDRVGKWATMTANGQTDSADAREARGGLPYSPMDPQSMYYGHDFQGQGTTMAPHHLSSTSSPQPAGLHYYDQSGYPQSIMATYDPTLVPSHSSTGSAASKSSHVEHSTLPPQDAFYSSPMAASAQLGPYPASLGHFPPNAPTPHVELSATGYHIMRTMSGDMSMGGTVVDHNVHGHVAAIPLSPSVVHNQHSHGLPMEGGGGVYYQQYASPHASQYAPPQAYYHTQMQVSGPSAGTGGGGGGSGYPAMMAGMQGGGYPPQQQQQQYPPLPSYGLYHTPYAASPYPAQQQQGAAYYSRSGWTPSQQHWRPPYYSNASLPSAASSSSFSSAYKRNSRVSSTNRSKGLSNHNTLPMRPGGTAVPSSLGGSSADASLQDGDTPVDSFHNEGAERSSGRGVRPHYPPQQGQRSDHVLWCGNVPSDASVEELWSFFSRLPLEGDQRGDRGDLQVMPGQGTDIAALSPLSGHGVLSIFVIARSNCAFVNYASPRHLQRATSFFHGQSLRPADSRCPKLVCRVRKKDDEAQAGVAGQRGRGIHVAWVKEQDRKMKQQSRSMSESEDKRQEATPAVASTPELSIPSSEEVGVSSSEAASTGLPLTSSDFNSSTSTIDEPSSKTAGKPLYSGASIDGSSGSISYTSTNSSLFRHPAFHERFFILKSLGTEDLDRSVKTGIWATQPHNEQVLDQAFRNSESVFLIFSANQSGGFYGYARMTGAILPAAEKQQLQSGAAESGTLASPEVGRRGSTLRPDAIPEGIEAMFQDGAGATAAAAAAAAAAGPLQDSASGSLLNTPEDAGHSTEGPVSSPLPLTPSTSPGDDADATSSKAEAQSLSPEVLVSKPMPPANVVVPELTATAPSGVVASATADTSPPLAPSRAPVTVLSPVQVAKGEDGVRRKDMMGEASTAISTLLNEAASLGPADSASHDPRSQNQVALKALIHNLRLEERDSMIRAENLERSMDAPLTQDGSITSPRSDAPDSFGKPFKVEWIKTTPLSFSLVRKLRNPWRDNRQIKVSRDGTELEPNTGRQLLREWQRVAEEAAGVHVTSSAGAVGNGDDDDDDV